MYRKLLPVLFFSCASAASYAQAPTLTAANINPVVNDSFISVVCQAANVFPGPSGASQTWDFHTLVDTTGLADTVNLGTVVYAAVAPGYASLSLAATALGSATFSTSTHAITN